MESLEAYTHHVHTLPTHKHTRIDASPSCPLCVYGCVCVYIPARTICEFMIVYAYIY